MGVFKSSDAVGTSIRRSSADYMVMNSTLDVLSTITHGGGISKERGVYYSIQISKNFCIQEGHFRENMV